MAFTAGQRLTAALLNAEFDKDRTVYASGDQSVVNSTVLVNSTALLLSLEANTYYTFDSLLIFDASSTGDFKYSLSVPTGTFVRQAPWTNGASASAAIVNPIYTHALDGIQDFAGGVAPGTFMTLRPTGLVLTSVTAGNLRLQFAQSVASGTTTLKAGSWIRLTKGS